MNTFNITAMLEILRVDHGNVIFLRSCPDQRIPEREAVLRDSIQGTDCRSAGQGCTL